MAKPTRESSGGSSPECWVVHFSGRVQGVGFRATARALAAREAVGGFVQNLPDGRVRMDIEGEVGVLAGLIEAVEERMAGYIDRVQVDRRPATSQFDQFQIRF